MRKTIGLLVFVVVSCATPALARDVRCEFPTGVAFDGATLRQENAPGEAFTVRGIEGKAPAVELGPEFRKEWGRLRLTRVASAGGAVYFMMRFPLGPVAALAWFSDTGLAYYSIAGTGGQRQARLAVGTCADEEQGRAK